jgi:hypothetical protein
MHDTTQHRLASPGSTRGRVRVSSADDVPARRSNSRNSRSTYDLTA